VRDADDALGVVLLGVTIPPVAEVVAFLLDDRGCGTGLLLSVTEAHDPDAVVEVAALVACAGAAARIGTGRSVSGLVLASVRPDGDVTPDDAERWCRASDAVDEHGLVLLEWFVLGVGGVRCPRDLTGEPDRWRRDAPTG